ncbi:MAG: DUF2520 domain-containing protein [Crocinitomicaceae bacterium]|nr:DUF2520 domain-containing protein [Crocinitomicaceae bacterium]
MKTPTISIVGNGNIANLFGQRFVDVGIEINSISTRNEQEGINLAKKLNTKFEKLNQITSEMIFVCVSDDAINSICNNIPKEKTIIYASGVIPLNEIKQANAGVFYPLQTISKNSLNASTKFPILIESKTPELKGFLTNLAAKITTKVKYVNSEERIKIHLAATFINNFSNHLIFLGQQYAKDQHLDDAIFNDLIQETFNKLNFISAYDAQTGPSKRKDIQTIQKHLDLLPENLKSIYLKISENISKTYN